MNERDRVFLDYCDVLGWNRIKYLDFLLRGFEVFFIWIDEVCFFVSLMLY